MYINLMMQLDDLTDFPSNTLEHMYVANRCCFILGKLLSKPLHKKDHCVISIYNLTANDVITNNTTPPITAQITQEQQGDNFWKDI